MGDAPMPRAHHAHGGSLAALVLPPLLVVVLAAGAWFVHKRWRGKPSSRRAAKPKRRQYQRTKLNDDDEEEEEDGDEDEDEHEDEEDEEDKKDEEDEDLNDRVIRRLEETEEGRPTPPDLGAGEQLDAAAGAQAEYAATAVGEEAEDMAATIQAFGALASNGVTVGSEVLVRGLREKAQHNGAVGTVKRIDYLAFRYYVEVAAEGDEAAARLVLRPANICPQDIEIKAADASAIAVSDSLRLPRAPGAAEDVAARDAEAADGDATEAPDAAPPRKAARSPVPMASEMD